jgi:hypothetical protein
MFNKLIIGRNLGAQAQALYETHKSIADFCRNNLCLVTPEGVLTQNASQSVADKLSTFGMDLFRDKPLIIKHQKGKVIERIPFDIYFNYFPVGLGKGQRIYNGLKIVLGEDITGRIFAAYTSDISSPHLVLLSKINPAGLSVACYSMTQENKKITISPGKDFSYGYEIHFDIDTKEVSIYNVKVGIAFVPSFGANICPICNRECNSSSSSSSSSSLGDLKGCCREISVEVWVFLDHLKNYFVIEQINFTNFPPAFLEYVNNAFPVKESKPGAYAFLITRDSLPASMSQRLKLDQYKKFLDLRPDLRINKNGLLCINDANSRPELSDAVVRAKKKIIANDFNRNNPLLTIIFSNRPKTQKSFLAYQQEITANPGDRTEEDLYVNALENALKPVEQLDKELLNIFYAAYKQEVFAISNVFFTTDSIICALRNTGNSNADEYEITFDITLGIVHFRNVYKGLKFFASSVAESGKCPFCNASYRENYIGCCSKDMIANESLFLRKDFRYIVDQLWYSNIPLNVFKYFNSFFSSVDQKSSQLRPLPPTPTARASTSSTSLTAPRAALPPPIMITNDFCRNPLLNTPGIVHKKVRSFYYQDSPIAANSAILCDKRDFISEWYAVYEGLYYMRPSFSIVKKGEIRPPVKFDEVFNQNTDENFSAQKIISKESFIPSSLVRTFYKIVPDVELVKMFAAIYSENIWKATLRLLSNREINLEALCPGQHMITFNLEFQAIRVNNLIGGIKLTNKKSSACVLCNSNTPCRCFADLRIKEVVSFYGGQNNFFLEESTITGFSLQFKNFIVGKK